MVFHIPRLRIPRLEVYDSHLVDLGLKWYRDIHTQLPRRLNGHILQDDVWEVISLFWHSVSAIEGRHKVPRMAGEREETTGAAGVSLGVMHYFPFFVSAYATANRRQRGRYHRKGCTNLSLAASWGLDCGSSMGTGRGSRRARRM